MRHSAHTFSTGKLGRNGLLALLPLGVHKERALGEKKIVWVMYRPSHESVPV